MTLTHDAKAAYHATALHLGLLWEALAINGGSFTCEEANAIAYLYTIHGMEEEGDLFLGHHAEGDDEGDQHIPAYTSDGNICGFTIREDEDDDDEENEDED